MLALWVVPQELGGGSGGIIGLASHAQKNHSLNSAVNSSFPFWDELAYKLWPLVLERLEFAVSAADRATPCIWWCAARRRLGSWRGAVQRYPAAVAAALAGDIRLPLVARHRGRDPGRVCRQPTLRRDRRDARRRQRLRRLRLGLRRSRLVGRQGVGTHTAPLARRSGDAVEQFTHLAGGSGHAGAARGIRAAARPLHEPHANGQFDPIRTPLPSGTARAVCRADPARGRRPQGDRLRGRHGRCRQHDDQQLPGDDARVGP